MEWLRGRRSSRPRVDTTGAVWLRSSRCTGADIEGNQHLCWHYLGKEGDITRSRIFCISQVWGKDLNVGAPVFVEAIKENTLWLRFFGPSFQYVPNIWRFENRFCFQDLKLYKQMDIPGNPQCVYYTSEVPYLRINHCMWVSHCKYSLLQLVSPVRNHTMVSA
jgi:hypothetical protein